MMKWESWNAKEEAIINQLEKEEKDLLNQLQGQDKSAFESDTEEVYSIPMSVVSTPFGDYVANSVFKPSDRWDNWIGYTNFPITEDVVRTLDEDIEGIEALAILGAYTFCVGVAKLFKWTDVRQEIEEKLCK